MLSLITIAVLATVALATVATVALTRAYRRDHGTPARWHYSAAPSVTYAHAPGQPVRVVPFAGNRPPGRV
jgi:hypothetical protein